MSPGVARLFWANRKCCACGYPCRHAINPYPIWVKLEFSGIGNAECGCVSQHTANASLGPLNEWHYEFGGNLFLDGNTALVAEYQETVTETRKWAEFTDVSTITYNRYQGYNWVSNSAFIDRFKNHGCRDEDRYRPKVNPDRYPWQLNQFRYNLEVWTSEDHDEILYVALRSAEHEGRYYYEVGTRFHIFYYHWLERTRDGDESSSNGAKKFGSEIPNTTYCGEDTQPRTKWGSAHKRHQAFTEAGSVVALPLNRPKTLSVTINDDGSNCSDCYEWPGSLYAQAAGWTAPGTYTATFLSSEDDCLYYKYRVPAFNWGSVNLFTDSGCSSAASPSSETVNGYLDVTIRYHAKWGWRVWEVQGPDDILKNLETSGRLGVDLSNESSVSQSRCGTAGDKIIRVGYTFKVEINEVI